MIFQGDPRLLVTPDGLDIRYTGGQPVLDSGLENQALISLFTREGWAGNDLYGDPEERVGSGFLAATEQPITMQALNDIRNAAELALASEVFGDVSVTVINPVSHRLDITVRIQPPGQDVSELLIVRNGQNWIVQANNPAHRRL